MHILIADDHGLVRDSIAAYLRAAAGMTVDVVASLSEAVEKVISCEPYDLVLLDYEMPGMDGLQGLQTMRTANSGRPVAILSGVANKAVAEEAISIGATGFVPKSLSPKSVITAVRFMCAGEVYAPVAFMTANADAASGFLSAREQDVLRGICLGKSNKEIASDHGLCESTIKLHAKTVCRKLGARNRTHAAIIACDRNII